MREHRCDIYEIPSLSERVCHPCARKIRNLRKLFVEINNATSHDEAEVEDLSNVTRSKRQLPTSVFIPERSPPNKKVTRTNSEKEVPSFRKSLFSEAHKQHKQDEPSNCSENQSTNEDLLLEHSNIDDLYCIVPKAFRNVYNYISKKWGAKASQPLPLRGAWAGGL